MKSSTASRRLAISGAAITFAAFLLFCVEPLVAKRILPWFGGAASVWSTCLVFYQLALLVGYAYAQLITARLRPRVQAGLHVALLIASLALLPIGPGTRWEQADSRHPVWLIFGMLAVSIGLPFALLSATTPLLQRWLADDDARPAPYALFALSNFASLAALLAYPLWIEPHLALPAQQIDWSSIYVVFVIVCGASAWFARAGVWHVPERIRMAADWPLWFGLAACGSMLLLSVTNHLTANVATVPLLWVIPLAIYLLTFVVSFSPKPLYKRGFWIRVTVMALAALAYAIYDIRTIFAVEIALPIFLTGLFVLCLFCHGELSALRPGAEHLPHFYLAIAAGGAAGALFTGVIAPLLFNGVYELPVTLLVTAGVASVVVWKTSAWTVRLLWIGITVAMLVTLVANVRAYREDSVVLERSFYGALRVVQTPRVTEQQTRTLFNGTIKHGEEFLWPSLRNRPTTYYGPDSGIGILLRDCYPGPKRVGVVGLGVGTVAAYGKAGDTFRFFEINPQVVNLAQGLFYFLQQSPAAISTEIGDGRLLLQRDQTGAYDVLALDAFSGDAVPVHLLTREALRLYIDRVKPSGTIAFHVSNLYLDLASVVGQLATEADWNAMLVRNHADPDAAIEAADWVIVTRNTSVLHNESLRVHQLPITSRAGKRPWTDNFSNLLELLRKPER